MNTREFISYLRNCNILIDGEESDIDILIEIYKRGIKSSNERAMGIEEKGIKNKIAERHVANFQLLPFENGIPLIIGFNPDTNQLKTNSPELKKFSNTQLVGSRNAKKNSDQRGACVKRKLFRTITMTPQTRIGINKYLFPKDFPIDMNNFDIINFRNERNLPINGIENIIELLTKGSILPVGINKNNRRHQGYFIPNFASLSFTFGIEHEVAFKNTPEGGESIRRYLGDGGETGQEKIDGIRNLMKDMGEFYKFQPAEFLRYSKNINTIPIYSNSPFQTKPTIGSYTDELMYSHSDPTAIGVEFSIGVGMLNEIMAFEHFFNYFLLNQKHAIRNPGKGYGMHINIGMSHNYISDKTSVEKFQKFLGSYTLIPGIFFQRMFRTKKRENPTIHNVETEITSNKPLRPGKVFIRFDDQKIEEGIIEYRFPHGALGGGGEIFNGNTETAEYTNNMIIMASKMTQDVIDMTNFSNNNQIRIPIIKKRASNDMLKCNLTSGSVAEKNIVRYISEITGITDTQLQNFIIQFNNLCKNGFNKRI